jgi:Na+-transporting methylmalonyl-CoA/oxaloacetate decarboxylase gamma subunit
VLTALWFVLAGMGIVFVTLGVLVLVMTLLNRFLTSEHGGPATRTPQTPSHG